MQKRLVYGVLTVLWAMIITWQVLEHYRVRETARDELINRAKDISNTAGSVMHALRRFGVVPRDRLEPALKPLIKPGDVDAIALLNEAEDVVASVGEPITADLKTFVPSGEPYWTDKTVTVMNLVELGPNMGVTEPPDSDEQHPVIVLEDFRRSGTNRSGPFRPSRTNRPPENPRSGLTSTNTSLSSTNTAEEDGRPPRPRGRFRHRPPPGRPFWMSEDEYKAMLAKQGVHSFVIVMATQSLNKIYITDLWIRLIIGLLATVAVVGFGMAWRNLSRSSELEVRLARASELNARLKEMNLAAAGLAHETRNPLNIVRGLAQMISKEDEVSPAVRKKSREIVDETDRVTAQLNEFINYSRPREVRRTPLALGNVVNEVVRALSFDIEEKRLKLEVTGEEMTIEADEQLLRQALFNLLLNAIQAVEPEASIQIAGEKVSASEGILEIRDNGPGVSPEHRAEIFKPYFTTNLKGTGLGLAVVQQIVLAHGWEIECLPNEPKGAIFRITHLRTRA